MSSKKRPEDEEPQPQKKVKPNQETHEASSDFEADDNEEEDYIDDDGKLTSLKAR